VPSGSPFPIPFDKPPFYLLASIALIYGKDLDLSIPPNRNEPLGMRNSDRISEREVVLEKVE
jgi:hypothetical protein